MTRQEALVAAQRDLTTADIPDAATDARRLLAWVLGDDLAVRRDPDVALTHEQSETLQRALKQRLQRIPVSHIIGTRSFFGRDFAVTSDVLDPRPETEVLVSHALDLPWKTVLDLGVGSGAILATLLAERPTAKGVGADISQTALTLAAQNLEHMGAPARAKLIASNWFEQITGTHDLIVANPPYLSAQEMEEISPELRHEPAIALSPGGDGLSAYRAIIAGARQHLSPGGYVLLEIGATQAEAVTQIAEREGWRHIELHRDLDHRPRVVSLRD